ncbi:MAG: hypothetical protein RQ723_11895 [Desulfuromonadales bacterium]|nr:hypothetical protein [Desulfuromonadales bacterium]
MVVGFNHNIRYKGQVYHVQTEDSGLKNPHIVTLLYRGGTILASKKTSYADIIRVDQLEQVVEELMKDQHKEMLRCLKAGRFDEIIARYEAAHDSRQPAEAGPAASPSPPAAAAAAQAPPPSAAQPAAPARARSLDEMVLSYLVGEDKPDAG